MKRKKKSSEINTNKKNEAKNSRNDLIPARHFREDDAPCLRFPLSYKMIYDSFRLTSKVKKYYRATIQLADAPKYKTTNLSPPPENKNVPSVRK